MKFSGKIGNGTMNKWLNFHELHFLFGFLVSFSSAVLIASAKEVKYYAVFVVCLFVGLSVR